MAASDGGVRPRGGRRPLEIRAAACELFATRGYESTSMQDVAEILGIRASSLYNHVESKQQILDEIGTEFVAGLHAALEAGLAMSEEPTEQVARGVEEEVRYKIRNPDAYVVMSRETLNVSPPVREKLIASRTEQRQLWRNVIERGIEEGALSAPSPELASLVLQELCSYLQVLHFVRENPTPEPQVVYWFGVLAKRILGV